MLRSSGERGSPRFSFGVCRSDFNGFGAIESVVITVWPFLNVFNFQVSASNVIGRHDYEGVIRELEHQVRCVRYDNIPRISAPGFTSPLEMQATSRYVSRVTFIAVL